MMDDKDVNVDKLIRRIAINSLERDRLLDRLRRFVAWKDEWGFSPHEISKIVLKPSGEHQKLMAILCGKEKSHRSRSPIDPHSGKCTYDSIVTLEDGREFFFARMNVKEMLDGTPEG